MKEFGFAKKDKLKQRAIITKLFSEGKAVTAYPLRLVYLPMQFEDEVNLKTAVSVSKRLHKKAVSRNRIKRLMREAFRVLKPKYFNKSKTSYAFMILYLSKDEPSFEKIEETMNLLLLKFNKTTSNTEQDEN